MSGTPEDRAATKAGIANDLEKCYPDLTASRSRVAEPDPAALRPMLQAMQSGEMTVSRGVELLDMWLAGNYSDDMLPPIRHGLGLDEMPWDRIDALTAEVARLAHELVAEKERADYAWRNTNTIEKARQEEMAKRDELLAALEQMIVRFDRFEVPFTLAELRRQVAAIAKSKP